MTGGIPHSTKTKRFVPGYQTRLPFARGIERCIAWFDADPARQQIDEAADRQWDRLIAAYEHGLAAARAQF
jgi:hypothetical protein